MLGFLHGVEIDEVSTGNNNITTVPSGVIGLVGTAPKGATNALTVISSSRQGLEIFGEDVPGFTIPAALDAIFAQGGAKVLVVNVFDPAAHTITVADETVTIANGAATLANEPVDSIVVTNAAGTTTYAVGVDFTITAYGAIRVVNTVSIPNGSELLVDYRHLDPAAITAVVVNGSAAAPRTGVELLEEADLTLGYSPKILISPTYVEEASTSALLLAKAAAFLGVALIDAPEAATPAGVIAGRGPAGGVPGFQTTDKRAVLLYPYVKDTDARNNPVNRPMSAYAAGLMSVVDATEGYWVSPSNHQLKSILGPATFLTSGFRNANSDVNQLNEVGVTSILNAFGTGFRLWGNRNASAPLNTVSDVFISVQRTKDVLNDSVAFSMLPFIDRPITPALIDSIREAVNSYLRTLTGLGAILDGRCAYIPADNPTAALAQGKLVFDLSFQPPTPAERVTFKSYLDQGILDAVLNA
jgi:phage tail sheath protein FI